MYACERRLDREFTDEQIYNGELARALRPEDLNPDQVRTIPVLTLGLAGT